MEDKIKIGSVPNMVQNKEENSFVKNKKLDSTENLFATQEEIKISENNFTNKPVEKKKPKPIGLPDDEIEEFTETQLTQIPKVKSIVDEIEYYSSADEETKMERRRQYNKNKMAIKEANERKKT